MGAVAPAAPPAAAQPWPPAARRPDRRRRHSLAAGHRCPVARSAGALRPVAHGVLALSALAAAGGVGAGADHPPSAGRCEGRAGWASALPGWHHGACPPARRGGQKGGGDQALGRSRGGFSSKIHLRTERSGKPITSLLTAGQRHEAPHLPALLEQGAVRRPGRGRPRLRPDRVVGDKGYPGQPTRGYLRRRGIGAVIPRRANESRRGGASTGSPTGNATASSAPSTASRNTAPSPPATKNWRSPTMPSSPSPASSSGCDFADRP